VSECCLNFIRKEGLNKVHVIPTEVKETAEYLHYANIQQIFRHDALRKRNYKLTVKNRQRLIIL
jgi:hypothetical protein